MLGLRIFRRVIPYYRAERFRTALGSLAIIASALAGLQAPRVVQRAVDALVNHAPLLDLWRSAALLLAISVFSGFFLFTQRQLLVSVSRVIEHRLRVDLYQHLLRLPPSYFMRQSVGDLLTRATSDVGAVRMAVGPGFMYAINTVVVTVVAVAFMLRIHPLLTLLTLLVLPVVAGATRYFGSRIHTRWGESQEALSRYTAKLQEHLVGLRVLRAYTCEDNEIAAMAQRNREYLRASARLISISALFHPMLQGLIGITFVVVLGVGGTAVRAGSMTVGQFVEFNLYLVRLIWPMIAVGWVANLLQRGAASMARIEEIFAQQPLPELVAQAAERAPTGPASVELRDGSFTFLDAPRPALAGVSFAARAGERIALVGGVGSGKSTLLSLIPRLLEPAVGTVFIDGSDVRSLPLAALRSQVALVPQGGFLFSATLRENIALARPDATEDDILAAARAAGLGSDLARFPHGLDTLVGERGVTLSGGQRQRTSLARAILTRPRLLLLDDCFSAVDAKTEREILRTLPATTVVFATHRLAAAELCDRVYYLERGRIVEAGTPAELVARGGRYARLLVLQRLDQDEPGAIEAV